MEDRGSRAPSTGFREYPVELRSVLGARYCTTCLVIRPGGSTDGEAELLQGDEPFTADVVARRLRGRGSEVASVRRLGPRKEWVAELAVSGRDALENQEPAVGGEAGIGGAPAAGRRNDEADAGQPPAYRYLALVGKDYVEVRNVVRYGTRGEHGEYVAYNWRRHRWDTARDLGTLRHEDHDGERFLRVSREQAERLARGFGQELPSDDVLDAVIGEGTRRRRSMAEGRQELYAARAERFAGCVAQLRTEGVRLEALPPQPLQVPGRDDRDRLVALQPALPVRFGEAFPLLRFMIGTFQAGNDRHRLSAHHEFHCNRVALNIADGTELDFVLAVSLYGNVLASRFSLTPFCPQEGYEVDESDFDLDSRYAKLIGLGYSPLEDKASSRVFPASRAGLRIEMAAARDACRTVVGQVALALTFPGGRRYLTAQGWEGGNRLSCAEFVPADRGFLASSPWLTGELDIFVPDDPHLLKTVWASFVPPADRGTRHQHKDFPGDIRYGCSWPHLTAPKS